MERPLTFYGYRHFEYCRRSNKNNVSKIWWIRSATLLTATKSLNKFNSSVNLPGVIHIFPHLDNQLERKKSCNQFLFMMKNCYLSWRASSFVNHSNMTDILKSCGFNAQATVSIPLKITNVFNTHFNRFSFVKCHWIGLGCCCSANVTIIIIVRTINIRCNTNWYQKQENIYPTHLNYKRESCMSTIDWHALWNADYK